MEATKLIDPVNNFDKMEFIPKYLIVSSSDEFMMNEWPRLYMDKIPGEKHLYVMPNTDHSMVTGLYSVLSNVANFINSVNKNKDFN